jgi:hypothetical protein
MSEPEKFLTRWSRRKLVVEAPVPPAAAEAVPQKSPEDDEGASSAAAKPAAPSAPEFDPASLPSLDSICAETDISAFLKPGVPGDLRLAALRRAWMIDPAIRDFKGLAENDWDFTVPNSTMGFGEIDPGLDLKKMLADVFGDTPRTEPPTAELPVAAEHLTKQPQELSSLALKPAEEPSRNVEIAEPKQLANAGDEGIVQRNINAASQTDDEESERVPTKPRRLQGGALPQ